MSHVHMVITYSLLIVFSKTAPVDFIYLSSKCEMIFQGQQLLLASRGYNVDSLQYKSM